MPARPPLPPPSFVLVPSPPPATPAVTGSFPATHTAGPAAPSDLGVWASAATGVATLQIANDALVGRHDSLAFSGVPISRSLALHDTRWLVLVGPNERRLQAQFNVLSRWGSGPTKANVPASSSVWYSLRVASTSVSTPHDAYAVRITSMGSRHTVDTGAATFVLDFGLVGLIASTQVGGGLVYVDTAGAGPSAVDGEGYMLNPTVDRGGPLIEEWGPIKAVVRTRGHFAAATVYCGHDLGYTMRMTFTRGSANVDLEFEVHNECGDGHSPASSNFWSRQYQVREVSWNFPLILTSRRSTMLTDGEVFSSSGADPMALEQELGSTLNHGWRRAKARRGSSILWSGSELAHPLVALGDAANTAAIALGWMRYREPQALVASGNTLSIRIVSDRIGLGEAQVRWNNAQLRFFEGHASDSALMRHARLAAAEIERGLLVKPPVAYINSCGVFPRLPESPSGVRLSRYLSAMSSVHTRTLSDWHRVKNFGITWPDTLSSNQHEQDQRAPGQFALGSNYWSATSSELMEFYRSGHPKWAWDFAIPAERTFLKAVVYNVGTRSPTSDIRSGFHAGNLGNGDQRSGQPFRFGYSSDDYLYNQGSDEAYLVRPSRSLEEVFAKACRTFIRRYDASETGGDEYVSQLAITRQVMQHVNMLRYAAEYVQDATLNQACHSKLEVVVQKYVNHNLFAGIFCAAHAGNMAACSSDAAFMYGALHADVFFGIWRHMRNASLRAAVGSALAETSRRIWQHVVVKDLDGAVDASAQWNNELRCTFVSGAIRRCEGRSIGEPTYPSEHPMLLSTVLMGDELASLGHSLCASAAAGLSTSMALMDWQSYFRVSGWWKGAAQSMRTLIHGLGVAESCDPD
mmetsp:Transcript_32853/g.76700  ORF Transcript_32853/g.76700 Transcript_32853/m.76700 type:complete len:861 (-) Transcript_32853:335-2917(-)